MKKSVTMLAIGLASGCHTTDTQRASWRPVVHAPVLETALLVQNEDQLEALRAGGAELIGWHEARDAFAARAAKTGGTHFYPVGEPPRAGDVVCYPWNAFKLCEASGKLGHWTRIAVLRVEPLAWHALPTELVPLEASVLAGAKPSALREGCEIHPALGTVTCGVDFQIGTYSYTGTPENVCVTLGGDSPAPGPDCAPLD